jgi:hypothetical protein
MALPKIDLPIFEVKLPSTREKVKLRPFTVKEEKILLVARESGAGEDTIIGIKQVVNNCLIDKDVSELAMFDLEFVLVVLRSRSVDNNVSFQIQDPDTEEVVDLSVDLDDITIVRKEDHTNKVQINEDYTLFLKYPTIDEFIKISSLDDGDPLASYFIMISCLDSVVSEDEVHYFKDYTEEEINDFMENTSGEVIKGIQHFFETVPKLRHEMKYTNKNGDEKTFVLEGMNSFFI